MLRVCTRLQSVGFGLALLVLCAGWSSPPDDTQTLFDDARIAWDEGAYPEALMGFQAVLDEEDGERFFDDIALITGELYETVEIAPDGRNLTFSPTGEQVAYEHVQNNAQHTVIVDLTGEVPEEVDRFEGTDFVFAPDGATGVYRRIQPTADMRSAAQAMRQARADRDRAAMRRANAMLEWHAARASTWNERRIEDGASEPLAHDTLLLADPAYDASGQLYVTGMNPEQTDRSHIYRFGDMSAAPVPVHDDTPGYRMQPQPVAGRPHLLYESSTEPPFPVPSDQMPASAASDGPAITLHNLDTGDTTSFAGVAPVLSRDGALVAYRTEGDMHRLLARSTDPPNEARTLYTSDDAIASVAVSPEGRHVAFTQQPGISHQVYLSDTETGVTEQFSRNIQHELFPEFLDEETLLAKMGEFRHRRAHLYGIATGDKHRIFHNNDIRTVSMEYEWDVAPSGDRVVLRADRDGNTITEEESVHLVDLTQRISMDALQARIADQLEAEQTLRDDAEAMFAPMHDDVAAATSEINLTRLYEYQKALYDFDSKYFTEPGNRKASAYIYETLESFGYEPEKQWFMPNGRDSTANVIARLEGSEHPEVTYIYSAHFDSVLGSPGADDNSTGTAVLLEMARVLADKELPATIIFASLTAEEAGLLGAREFVRRADEEGLQVAGVVNNDMMGWTRHHRLDNTIRFSNYGIRDIQHASSILFSDLITYDSRYYRFTDAQVFFEAYGDVLGGIGSYPILGNPNYHQPTDRLETINHRLVRAVAQSTTGVFMKLAHTPSMVRGLHVEQTEDTYTVRWDEPLESDITHYEVRYHTPDGETVVKEIDDRSVVLDAFDTEAPVAVRAVNGRDLPGWDWAEVVVE
ncbi:MAG: M28 family peptidase [Longimonas sp.]|uniref:M28 family peptidase n=1 Tax=Longimonas sp. TaxID=2039626 RepID=UPI00334BA5AE